MGLTFITGGVRSGKSRFAEKLAEKNGSTVLYVATGVATFDQEMETRIVSHQIRRPNHWGLLEVPYHFYRETEVYSDYDVILVDCISTWITNQMMQVPEEKWQTSVETEIILREIDDWLEKTANFHRIVVSTETGLGGVAMSPLGRWFQDVLGEVNQKIAEQAEGVYIVVSGIPWRIKG